MEMQNEQRLALPRQTVWDALNDPEVLKACIPGCESFDKAEENTYDATVSTKVGPVKARFKGRVTLQDLNPPESYTLSFEGQGGQAGFAKGNASVSLTEEEGETRVSYQVHATVGGKLAQLGSRLVNGAAQKTANDFFENFVQHMGGGEEQTGEETAGETPAGGAQPQAGEADRGAGQQAEAQPAESKSGGGSAWAWIVALIVIVVVIALFAF